MSKPERQLRIFQIICILFTAVCAWLTHWLTQIDPLDRHASTISQGFVVLAALWSAVSGFTMQRKIARLKPRPGQSARSTPSTRWLLGHILRLATAVSVGLWAFFLHFIGGYPWLTDSIFGLSLILLLIWQPGTTPEL
jgi:hypothetical protein